MLLMAVIMPWKVNAQETLTVCDGTTTNSYIPIYGSYVDTQGTTSEFIIPANTEGMNDLVGTEITELTFYISSSPASWGEPIIQVYMGEVEGTILSGLYGPTNTSVTIVATKTLSNTQATMVVEFDTPYTYEGGNLLIGTYVQTKSSSYKATNFYGISAPSGSSWNKYSSYGSGSAQSFLPKTTFTYTPTAGGCGKPSTVTAANITSNSATINWTEGSGTYNVQYKKSSETTWIDRVTNYTGTSVELTGLEANTTYQVQVQSICEGNVTSTWKSGSFETPCATEETFPFSENFNSLTTNGEIPGCWNNDEGTTTNANYKWSYYATGHEGKCVRFNSYSNSYNTNFLKTVPMNLPANKTMQLRFWYKNPTGGDFTIYISTDGGATHTNILEEHLENQTDWTEKEIVMGNYVGQTNVVIVFKGTSNNGSGDAYIYLDDVYVEEAPTCPKQSGLHYTAVTSSSVTLDWTTATNDQDHWDLFITTDATITPDANTTPTVINTNQKPYSHSGLNDGTTYYAYVRARCSEIDQSPWSSSCKFTTPQTPVAIDGNHPYNTDFESGCDWMFINGDYINQWCYGSAANNTTNGEKAIYISNDNGVTNAYSPVKSVEYAIKNFTFAEGVYTFSFDWRAKGNQYYDFIRVALVPSSVELISTENAPFDKTSLPSGWIALDGGSGLNNNTSWQTVIADEISVPAGDYRMVVGWRNFTYGSDNQPPAAIDNVNISLLTCPRPTALTASNITGRTASLTWTENGTATNWVLQYATDNGFTENLSEISVSGTTSQELAGLTPETKYYARVKSVLGNEESSWSDVKDFTTLATCPKPTASYVSYSATAYTGTIQWTGSTADAFEVAYRPTSDFDPSDLTLENVTRVQLENVSNYTYTLESLTPETKYYIYVQANCGGEDGKSSWSNRVIFTTLATCLAPTSLDAEGTSSTTIMLSWTAGAEGQDAWDIQYKKTSATDWIIKHIEQEETTYTMTGLEPATEYEFKIRAFCDIEDQSSWYPAYTTKKATTECAALSLPFTCDFESNLVTTSPYSTSNPYPNCWSRIAYQSGNYGSYTYYPYVFTATYSQPYAHGGNGANNTSGHSLRFYQTSNSTNECAVLPEISSDYNMNSIQIRFWGAVQSSQGTLHVGIMESPTDANTFTSIQEVNISNTYSNGFQEFTIPFSDYNGEGRYIAFMCGTGSSYAYFLIDDVTIEEVPSCQIPTGLEATVNSATEAVLTWTAGLNETDWELEVVANGSSISQSIPVSGTPTYSLSTIRATNYTVRVRANCGDGDFSDWSSPISFTSDCGVLIVDATHPFLEDFENVDASDFPPICWEKFNHEMSGYNYWYLNSNNGLGSNAAYSYWNEGYAFLVMPKMHIDGNATLSFDYLIGSGTYDESCSVVVSTGAMTYADFNQTIWAADGNDIPSGKTNATVSLSSFDNQDIYVAFKFKGLGTSGCSWYIDNVQVYVGAIFTKDITAYSGDGGYYLIASPIGTVNPENVMKMLNNDYDLYYFDQAQDLEWRNYEASSFNLEAGKGYLYANSEDVTLRFNGTPYNGSGVVDLTYTTGADLAGWNLIGNPFATTATLDKPYYRLNTNGSALKAETESTAVAAMEGVFVQATEANQNATFTAQTRGSEQATIARTNIMVGNDNGNVLDNAIVRFDNGETLGKFQLRENSTKVYIPVDGKDYAIVNAKAQNELPVNFKAAKNGTYTLSVNTEYVEINYLHLVDNMTGNDIDLLANPSYTFEAKTTDYASRFRLVFEADDNGASTSSSAFAYYNGNNWVISNPSTGSGSEATLQVLDVMGRVLRSEILNGNAEINLNQPAGIYMLRLVNGENVKTQKVVVR